MAPVPEIDFVGLARAFGCPARRIATLTSSRRAFDEVVPGLEGREEPLFSRSWSSPTRRSSRNAPSDGEERRLDQSPWRRMSKRRPRILGSRSGSHAPPVEVGEDRVRGIRLLLVREVEPRHELLEQPAGEHEDDEVRGLQPPSAPGTRPGLTVTNSNHPSSIVPERPNPTNPSSSGISCARPPGARSGRRVRLPDLDHAVRDGIAVAVEQSAANPDRARVVLGH